MANPTPTGAPRVPPGRDSLARTYEAAVDRRRGYLLYGEFKAKPLSGVPALLLRIHREEQILDGDGDSEERDELKRRAQEIYSLGEGVRQRLLKNCGIIGHDEQAATLLVAIEQLDFLLDGAFDRKGEKGLRQKLEHEEYEIIWTTRDAMIRLLEWHMCNGAGALLPIAEEMGLTSRRAA